MKVTQVTAPTDEPVTIDETKHFLRIDDEDSDALIISLIKISREYAESVTGRALMTQTWKYYLDDFPSEDYIELPFPPLSSITHLKYTDTAATQTEFSSTAYSADTAGVPGRLVLGYNQTWPTATLATVNPIEIQFVCGYGTPDDIPESLKQGMKIDIGNLFENRETIVINQSVNHIDTIDRLYAPYRTFRW